MDKQRMITTYNPLPEYFNNFYSIFSEVISELLVTIENSFARLYYVDHFDDIESVFTDYASYTIKDKTQMVLHFYRQHIDAVLVAQGVYLTNPFTDPLPIIVAIQQAVSILGTTKLSEIYPGEAIDQDDTGELFIATIIHKLTEVTIEELLTAITSVNHDVIEYLRQDHIVPYVPNLLADIAQKRFMESTIPKEGMVTDFIKTINKFGYTINSFMLLHGEQLANLIDPTTIANEVVLLTLGSDIPDNILNYTISDIIDKVIIEPNLKLRTNAIAIKLLEKTNA